MSETNIGIEVPSRDMLMSFVSNTSGKERLRITFSGVVSMGTYTLIVTPFGE